MGFKRRFEASAAAVRLAPGLWGGGQSKGGQIEEVGVMFFLCENAFTIRRSRNLPNIANVGAITGSQAVDEEERTLWPARVHVLLKSNKSYDILSQILRESFFKLPNFSWNLSGISGFPRCFSEATNFCRMSRLSGKLFDSIVAKIWSNK